MEFPPHPCIPYNTICGTIELLYWYFYSPSYGTVLARTICIALHCILQCIALQCIIVVVPYRQQGLVRTGLIGKPWPYRVLLYCTVRYLARFYEYTATVQFYYSYGTSTRSSTSTTVRDLCLT